MDDADDAGAKPRAQNERPALWAVVAAACALAALALEVKRPDIVRGALDFDLPFSSITFGVIGAVLSGFAVRRSPLRALPGIAMTAIYWATLVAVLW
jgi:hypothetical protein